MFCDCVWRESGQVLRGVCNGQVRLIGMEKLIAAIHVLVGVGNEC